MSNVIRQATMLVGRLTVMALASLALTQAAVIQSTVVLPPASGELTLGGVCVSALSRCTQDATVSGFNILTRTIQNGNEVVLVNAIYSADVFMENGGLPSDFLGHLSLSGSARFTFVGRDPSVNPLGAFVTEITDFVFQGTLNGNTFEVKQDPAKKSVGLTTILPATSVPPILYSVSGSLELFAEYSFNGSPFTARSPADGRTGAGAGTGFGHPGSHLSC